MNDDDEEKMKRRKILAHLTKHFLSLMWTNFNEFPSLLEIENSEWEVENQSINIKILWSLTSNKLH